MSRLLLVVVLLVGLVVAVIVGSVWGTGVATGALLAWLVALYFVWGMMGGVDRGLPPVNPEIERLRREDRLRREAVARERAVSSGGGTRMVPGRGVKDRITRRLKRLPAYDDVRSIDAPAVPLWVYLPLLRQALDAAVRAVQGPSGTPPTSDEFGLPHFQAWWGEYDALRRQLIAARNPLEEAKPEEAALLPLHWAAVAFTRTQAGSMNYFMGMMGEHIKGNYAKSQEYSGLSEDFEAKMEMMSQQVADAYNVLFATNPAFCALLDLSDEVLVAFGAAR